MPKNKKKLNDKIVNSKNNNKKKTVKEEKYISEESKEMRNFLIILFSIIIIVLIVYGVSKIFIDDEPTEDSGRTVQTGQIDYDKVSIGTMLNRNYSEYYVAIYDEEDTNAVVYSSIITKYLENEDAIKVFFCDLGNKLNSKYYVGSDGETNPNAQDISELALGDLTLIKVENGEITDYIEGLDAFRAEFSK